MFGGKLALALVAASIGPAAASAPSPAGAPMLELEQALGICRMAFAEQLAGRQPAAALDQLRAPPEAQRASVVIICAAYETGQQDLLQVLRAMPVPPPSADATAI